ncbi:hypothetical protein SAY87_013142 [Trapa incisa]|uniref:Uncharacterized protein n=1 Tax=Trapa incisa TaxID=236973 RepID=A0AAN7KB33_9MYRT|nr:hypothetical protein SAY87_013142 [Trapa incisa]
MGAIVEAVGGVGTAEPCDKVNEEEEEEEKERNDVRENQERGNVDDESMGKEVGCWDRLRFRFTMRCISSRSKVDSSVSNSSANYVESKSTNDVSRDQPTAPAISSTTISNAESNSSTFRLEEELRIASRLQKFTFNNLNLATRNFMPESLLGEGGFGCVFKGWIEENGTVAIKIGTQRVAGWERILLL